MPRTPPYRTAAGAPARPGVRLMRWHLLLLLPVALLATVALIAGSLAPDVLTAALNAAFLIPILLPAAALGVLLTTPFARPGRNLFAATPYPDLFRLVTGTALGLGAVSLAMLALGSAHLLRHGIPLAVPAAALGAGYLPTRDFLKRFDLSPLKAPATGGDYLLLLAALPVAVLVIGATFPPSTLWYSEAGGYDALEYHLQLPREYIANGATAPLRHNVYSYLPANVEMLYLLQMHFAALVEGQHPHLLAVFPAQFLHATLALLTALAIFLAPLPLSRFGRVLAALAFLGAPWVLVTGSLAYNDAGMTLFGALALAFTLAPTPASSPTQSSVLSPQSCLVGLLLGLAVGCKLTAGVMFAVPVAAVLLARHQIAPLLLTAAVAGAVYAPWAVRAAADTHNPVFPLATSVFGTGHWSADQAARWDAGHRPPPAWSSPLARLHGLARESVLDPYFSYIPARNEPAADARATRRPGPLWVAVFVAVAIALARGPAAWTLLLVLALQVLAWLTATHLQGRFLAPALVPLAWLIALGTAPLLIPRIVIGTLIGAHAALAALILIPDANLFFGPRDSRPFFIGVVPSYPYPKDASVTAPETASFYLLGDATPFYYRGPVTYATTFDRQTLLEVYRAAPPDKAPAAARQYLYDHRVNFLCVNAGEIDRLAASYGFDDQYAGLRAPERRAAYRAQMSAVLASITGATVAPFFTTDAASTTSPDHPILPEAPFGATAGTRLFMVTPPAAPAP